MSILEVSQRIKTWLDGVDTGLNNLESAQYLEKSDLINLSDQACQSLHHLHGNVTLMLAKMIQMKSSEQGTIPNLEAFITLYQTYIDAIEERLTRTQEFRETLV